jgi:ribosome biogenesis GTPase
MNRGLVVAGYGRHYSVETPNGQRILCHPRGKKSELVVGDWVLWAPMGQEGVIEQRLERRNLLYRQDLQRTKAFAANLDQVLMMVAVEPGFSLSQISRALIAAEHAGIQAQLVLNKTDLPGFEAAWQKLAPFRQMGTPVHSLSLTPLSPQACEQLCRLLDGQKTLVLGPSGVGKSTLINALVPQAQAQVAPISTALNSGRHTTTRTLWYWLDDARHTALIDSPGFQEFGLNQIQATELATLMPDMKSHLGQCRFYNCTHRQEPGCGVRQALNQGLLAPERMAIYEELWNELGAVRW